MELEEATAMLDEVQIPVEAINLDEALYDKLVKFTSPKVSVSRVVVKSLCMDQMILLKKMDRKRLKEKPADDNDCCTHQCKHWSTLLSFPWKVNGKIMSRPTDGPGACHTAHAQRHLEKR